MTIEIPKSKILYFFLWFSYIKPDAFNYIIGLKTLDEVYNISRVVSAAIILYLAYKIKASFINIYSECIIVYFIILSIMTAQYHGSYQELLIYISEVTGAVLLVCCASNTNTINYCIGGLLDALCINLVINSITVFAFFSKGGMYPDITKNGFYLGYDNIHLIYILIYFTLSIYYDYSYYDRIRLSTVVVHLVINIAVIICWSGTAVISLGTFYILIILSRFSKLYFILNEFFVVGVNAFFFITVVIESKFNIVATITLKLVGKALNNNRKYMWIRYEKYITGKFFLFGHGYMNSFRRVLETGYVHAHNVYLDLLYEVGICGLLLFLFMVFMTIRITRLYGPKHKHILLIGVFSYLIAFQSEGFSKLFLVILLTISYFVSITNYEMKEVYGREKTNEV